MRRFLLASAAIVLVAAPLHAGSAPGKGDISFVKAGGSQAEFHSALKACYDANTKICQTNGSYSESTTSICLNRDGLQACMLAAGYQRDDRSGPFHADFTIHRSGGKYYAWRR